MRLDTDRQLNYMYKSCKNSGFNVIWVLFILYVHVYWNVMLEFKTQAFRCNCKGFFSLFDKLQDPFAVMLLRFYMCLNNKQTE